MININMKTKERFSKSIKKFQPILSKAKTADINESDTVVIIADMLNEVFGYDKYLEITSEYAIKKTFCDLAIKVENKVSLLIECKAIGMDLKDDYIRQATGYAADSGIEWVVLTNGIEWKIFKVIFSKPIEKELVYNFDFLEINTKRQDDLEALYYISKEAFVKTSKIGLEDLHIQKQLLNKFISAQLLTSENVVDVVKKQLKKMSNDLKPSNEEIESIIVNEILKREVCEGEKFSDAKKKVAKMIKISKITKVVAQKELE